MAKLRISLLNAVLFAWRYFPLWIGLVDAEKYWLTEADGTEGFINRIFLPTGGLLPSLLCSLKVFCVRGIFKWERCDIFFPERNKISLLLVPVSVCCFKESCINAINCLFNVLLLLAPQSLIWQEWPSGKQAPWDLLSSGSLQKCRWVEKRSSEALERMMVHLPPFSYKW